MALNIEQWMSQGLPAALAVEMQKNLGGTLRTDLSGGNHLVTVPDEDQNLRHVLTGALSVARTYTFPAVSGFYFVDNQTTGGKATTLAVTGGSSTVQIYGGQQIIIFVDGVLATLEPFSATSVTVNITHADSTYTVPANVNFITADTSAGSINVVLPAAISYPSRSIGVVKTADANAVVITSAGGQIGGTSTYTLNAKGESIEVNSNASDWWIF